MGLLPLRLKRRRRDKTGTLTAVALIIASALLAFVLIFNLLYTRIYVVGPSMRNTLTGATAVNRAGGDYVYICGLLEPKRGDIVVIDAGDKNLIKRVIALGGDSLKMDNGALSLKVKGAANYTLVDEPYVDPENNKNPKKNTFDEISVDEGCVFFMGDNRDDSEDSRGSYYGIMPVDSIVGVVTGWSMQCKSAITSWNTFFEFTLPGIFGA